MKIRNGFVSNSSSSSFCLLGVYLNEITGSTDKLAEDGFEDKTFLIMEYAINEEDGNHSYGLEPNKIPDDKTLSQVKDEIVDEFARLGFTILKRDVGFIHDGGYEG